MKKIAIILNPKSGRGNRKNRADLINRCLPRDLDCDMLIWEKREQKEELFQKALSGDYDIVVAAGGDGTVNSVAAALSGSNKTLGIIPFGSGNGLARHLQIPLETAKAVELLSTGNPRPIDTCYLDGKPFFCTAGVGFDAHISNLFVESKMRGMISYAVMTFREVLTYKTQKYILTVDGKVFESNAFLIAFANAAQYGGDAFVAPLADIQDGIIDVTLIRPFPLLSGIPVILRMFAKNLQHSSRVTLLKGKHILLERNGSGPVHRDGEPEIMGEKLEVSILQRSLKVITP